MGGSSLRSARSGSIRSLSRSYPAIVITIEMSEIQVSGCVDRIKKQFMAGISQHSFDWQLSDGDWAGRGRDWQLQVLYSTVWHPLAQKYPPSFSSRKSFVKALISKLESVGADTCDEVYDVYTGFLSDECLPSGYSYKTYILSEELVITLREGSCMVDRGTTGFVSWDGSKILSEWCVENSDIFHGRTVIELGCGSGLAGLVVVKSCNPLKYIFTDGNSEVLRLLRYNLMLNVESHAQDNKREKNWTKNSHSAANFIWNETKIVTAELDWENCNSLERYKPDIVVAADVIYDVEMAKNLLAVLSHFLNCHGTTNPFAIIACSVRNEDTHLGFLNEAGSRGFSIEKLPLAKSSLFFKTEGIRAEVLKLSLLPSSC